MPDLMTKVEETGAAYREALADADARRLECDEALRAAHTAGHAPKELIERSGLARQTVFTALKRPAPPVLLVDGEPAAEVPVDGRVHQVQTVSVD
jgi:hypothetical protein